MELTKGLKERIDAFFESDRANELAIHIGKVLTEAEVMEGRSSVYEFIDFLDNETINKIRNSKSDAEVRRILKETL